MIREIKWTTHALRRLRTRKVSEAEVEATIRSDHLHREKNPGEADWQVTLVRWDGERFAVLYDHPVWGEASIARVVTVLRQRRPHVRH